MGRKTFVPVWTITDKGEINPIKLDIAREFVLEGQGYFKFLDYIQFMTAEKVDIGGFVAPETLSMMFILQGSRCLTATSALSRP
jgi:hypothetical protein